MPVSDLCEIVAAEGLLDEGLLAAAAAAADDDALVVRLVAAGVPEQALAAAVARRTGLPLVEIEVTDIDVEALRQVSHITARGRHVVPLVLDTPRSGPSVLRVAMADPTDGDTIRELAAASGCRVTVAVARLSAVVAAVTTLYRGQVTAVMGREAREAPRRAPFGGDLGPRTATEPFRHLEDEAPLELRHRALLDLLVAKGVITWDEYGVELRRLLGRDA